MFYEWAGCIQSIWHHFEHLAVNVHMAMTGADIVNFIAVFAMTVAGNGVVEFSVDDIGNTEIISTH